MEALGRLFNVQYAMDDVYVNLKNAGGVTFVCYLAAGDTWTLTEDKLGAGADAQVLATITRYWTSTGTGADTWTLTTQAAGSSFITAGGGVTNMAVFSVEASELSDGYKYVKCTSTGAGIVIAIHHDLVVARKPSNLLKMGV